MWSLLILGILLGQLNHSQAVFHLEPPPPPKMALPDNTILNTQRLSTNGKARVAVATRSLYRCTSFTGLITSYNSLKEEIIPMPPSKFELSEWVEHNMGRIGTVMTAGIGSDYENCNIGSEFKSASWVESSEITKNCYPSNLWRYSCFMSWLLHFKIIELPTFLDTSSNNLETYIVTPAGEKLEAKEGAYRTKGNHALLIISTPKKVTAPTTLNCFNNHENSVCIDNTFGDFVQIPKLSEPIPASTMYVCQFTHCHVFTPQNVLKLKTLISASALANLKATRNNQIRKKRDNQNLPTETASYADIAELQSHVNILYQTNLYNIAILSNKINELERIQYHTVLSLAKLDDYFLSNLWQHSFSTHFLNYNTFVIRPHPIPLDINSNCRRNQSEIYVAGRFVPKKESDHCMSWENSNVTKLNLYTSKDLIMPSFSNIEHIKTNPEFSWTYLMAHRHGLEEAMVLRQYGGATSTGLADVLQFSRGSIPEIIATLFGLSGFSTLGFLSLIIIIVLINKC